MNPHQDQFKFEVDPNSQAEPYQKQGNRSSARSIGVAILIMMVLILMLAMGAGFFYLNHRLGSTLSSAIEVSDLSQKMENHFSSLSVKQARLEAALETIQKELTTKTTEIEQATNALNQKIDQQNENSKEVMAQKIGPEEFQKAMAVVENKLADTDKAMADNDKKLEAINAVLTDLADQLTNDRKYLEGVASTVTGQLNEFEGILNETAKSVITLKTDLADVAGSQLDKKALGQEIKRQLSTTNRRITEFNTATEALTGRIQNLQNKITSLQQNGGIFEREILKLRGQMNDLQRQINARPLPTEKVP